MFFLKGLSFFFVFFIALSCMGAESFHRQDKQKEKSLKKEKKNDGDYVILLHGMGRTSLSLFRLQWFLSQKGYKVINYNYPSTKYDIKALSRQLEVLLQEKCRDKEKKIHFVTHSLGGIIVRAYLDERDFLQTGRVVMLAPPNKGTEVVDWLKDKFLYKWITGPSGQQLGTDDQSMPLYLGTVDFDLGIIAGDKSFLPPFSSRIFGPDDGFVSVERAKAPGMKDFLVVHSSHTFIMNDKEVLRQVVFFLENGCFNKKDKDETQ